MASRDPMDISRRMGTEPAPDPPHFASGPSRPREMTSPQMAMQEAIAKENDLLNRASETSDPRQREELRRQARTWATIAEGNRKKTLVER